MDVAETRWVIAKGVAWVDSEGRVSAVDTRVQVPTPLVIGDPVATLWRRVAEEPRTGRELIQSIPNGHERPNGEDPHSLMDVLGWLAAHELIAPVGEGQ